jgi:hypothetical protein
VSVVTIDEMLRLSPIERLRQNDRVASLTAKLKAQQRPDLSACDEVLKNVGVGTVPRIQLPAIVGEGRLFFGFLESGGDIPYPSFRVPVLPQVGDQERVLDAIANLTLPASMSAADDRQSVDLGACLSHHLLTRPHSVLPDTRDSARRKKADEEDAAERAPAFACAALDALSTFSPQSAHHIVRPPCRPLVHTLNHNSTLSCWLPSGLADWHRAERRGTALRLGAGAPPLWEPKPVGPGLRGRL